MTDVNQTKLEIIKQFYLDYLKPIHRECKDVMYNSMQITAHNDDIDAVCEFYDAEIQARINQLEHGADLDESIESSPIVINQFTSSSYRLPNVKGNYVVLHEGVLSIAWFNIEMNAFEYYDPDKEYELTYILGECWLPIPSVPKKE